MDGSSARTVSTSAAGLISLWLMPNALSSAGVATYGRPPAPRPCRLRIVPYTFCVGWPGCATFTLTARSSSSGAGACNWAAIASACCRVAASFAAGVNCPGWYWVGSLPGL